MKKIKVKKFNIYEINKEEFLILQYFDFFGNCCDQCNSILENEVYYIPILHYCMCKKCYQEWIAIATYYKEDEAIMKYREIWIEKIAKKLNMPIKFLTIDERNH